MADDTLETSPKNDRPARSEAGEDAETRAARRELKQSSISDPPILASGAVADLPGDDKSGRVASPTDDGATTTNTEDTKDQLSSPKKKRAHDQLDGAQAAEDNDATSVASTDSAKDRASRLEPEKKRHRDADSKDENSISSESNPATNEDKDSAQIPTQKAPQTSASAFAASGFGKLAAGSSPFASLGGASTSAFASPSKPSLTSFASPAANSAPKPPIGAPKLTFGTGSGAASPFAGLSSGANGFGGGISGSGFGSALSGIKPLGSFAAPGSTSLLTSKSARPFGAPDSDVEEEEEEGDNDGDKESQPDDTERARSPEKESEEKKRIKLQKVEVNDGEAGEVTIVSVRAKMFYHEKEVGWKERGAGMLKINAPQACVEFDDAGAVILGSFDASGLEADDDDDVSKGHRVVRLIMRQDQTHRVILNTAILPAMDFQDKASLKSVGILFTAFEGDEARPVSVTMKMSAANAKIFLNEIGVIKRELQNS